MADPLQIALRNTIKQIRQRLPHEYHMKISRKVCSRIRNLREYRYAKRIGLYFAVNGEIDLEPIWRTAPYQGKFCYFPVINEDGITLSFLPATPATPFALNRYGIPEPEVSRDQAISLIDLDIIFVPLVAFDTHCTRLGMGAGYYDRTFAQLQANLFGVAYQFQQVDYIQPYPWDIPMNAVITQNGIQRRVES